MEKAPFDTDLAEAPRNGKAFWIYTKDETRLRIGMWKAKSRKKGTVILFPGRADHMELYGRLISALLWLPPLMQDVFDFPG